MPKDDDEAPDAEFDGSFAWRTTAKHAEEIPDDLVVRLSFIAALMAEAVKAHVYSGRCDETCPFCRMAMPAIDEYNNLMGVINASHSQS